MKTIIVVLLLELFVNCHEIHTFVVHDLHNLGDIMSDYYDEITLKIHTT